MDKIINRIRKMLALANDAAATEGERDNALRMAHATLAKYNLSMSEVGKKEESAEKRMDKELTTADFPWMRKTAQAIAKLFFCEYFFVALSGGKMKNFFIGKESNVLTAIEMTSFVLGSIRKEGSQRGKTADSPSAFARSFAKGAADSIVNRCYEIRTAATKPAAASTTGTSLVLANFYEAEIVANKDYISKSMGIALRTRKSKEKAAGSGYTAGREFGKSIPLNVQLN